MNKKLKPAGSVGAPVRFILLAVLAVIVLPGCADWVSAPWTTTAPSPTPNSSPEPAGSSTSFKGWELYFWPEEDTWQYALLPGTNRLKTDAEITAADVRLNTVDAVTAALTELAPGEWVTLLPRAAGTTPPPAETLAVLTDFCREHQLNYQTAY